MSCDTDEGRIVKMSNVGRTIRPATASGMAKMIRFSPGLSLMHR